MHRLTYMVGKAHVPLKPIYPAMLRVMGLVSKRHIDPADGNCAPRGFKEYDKRTNGHRVLRSREWTAIRHLLSSIVPATKSSEHHVGGGQRTEKASSRMTVSMRAKGDYAMHSARFCDHMPLYVNSERLLWYPLWMTAVG